jgi:hypothetical protein
MSNFNENLDYVIERHGLQQDEIAALLLTYLARRFARLEFAADYMAYYLQQVAPAFYVPYNGKITKEESARQITEIKQLRFTLDMELQRLNPTYRAKKK